MPVHIDFINNLSFKWQQFTKLMSRMYGIALYGGQTTVDIALYYTMDTSKTISTIIRKITKSMHFPFYLRFHFSFKDQFFWGNFTSHLTKEIDRSNDCTFWVWQPRSLLWLVLFISIIRIVSKSDNNKVWKRTFSGKDKLTYIFLALNERKTASKKSHQ